MSTSDGKPPHRDLKFRITVLIGIVVISGYITWYFVLPLTGKYEKLQLYSYYWVNNSRNETKQLVVRLLNNGTQTLTINNILIDGSEINLTSGEIWLDGRGFLPKNVATIIVVPRTFLFQYGRSYNFTIVTLAQSHYNFMLEVNENNTRTERLRISDCTLFEWPPDSTAVKYIGVEVTLLENTFAIVKTVYIDDYAWTIDKFAWTVSPPLWLSVNHNPDEITLKYAWIVTHVYNITIETVAGTTAQFNATRANP